MGPRASRVGPPIQTYCGLTHGRIVQVFHSAQLTRRLEPDVHSVKRAKQR